METCVVKDEDGLQLAEMDHVLERWRKYCAQLYDCNEDPEVSNPWVVDEPDILPLEVQKALNALKNRKTPVKDGIPVELGLALATLLEEERKAWKG
ncbi:unnamed protein product, partial [Iphiclides podalirius]